MLCHLARRPSTIRGICLFEKKRWAAATAASRQSGSLTARVTLNGVMWGGAQPNELCGSIAMSL